MFGEKLLPHPYIYCAGGAAAGAPFLATKSVDPRSPIARVNLIVSPSALPVYVILNSLPLKFITVSSEMLSPSTLPLVMSVSPRGVVTYPVSVVPST